jgi:ADP-heptose:LPS heptosyltransferase
VAADHLRLIDRLASFRPTIVKYNLPPIGEARISAPGKLREASVDIENYVVLHMGSGRERKTWQPANWAEVARQLLADGAAIVLTGAGEADAARTRDLVSRVRGVVNLCDRLSWNELRYVLAHARATISVDTAAAHLSAAEGTPTTVLMTGMDDPSRWRPIGDHVTVLSERVPCWPCYKANGCAAMSCIAGVTPDVVLAAARRHLTARASGV